MHADHPPRFASHRTRRPRRRAVALLEFVAVLPMFLFMMLFVVDAGRIMMASGVLQDATYRAARAGATYGAAAPPDGSQPSRQAFERALDEIPGLGGVEVTGFRVLRGAVCTAADPYVQIEVSYDVQMVTPGLAGLLSIAGRADGAGLPSDGAYSITATALARCEVAA